MERTKETTINIIKRKGVVEYVYLGASVICRRLFSVMHLMLLRMRGYDAAYSVTLSGDNVFFQNTKHAITIGKKTIFGRRTRLDAGFGGKITIGEHSLIDDHCFITAQSSIVIGNNVLMAAYCFVTDFNHAFSDRSRPINEQGYVKKPVIIENDVWIGAHSIILPGVHIGNGAVIGAGSVVTHDVKPFTIVAGNPAAHIRNRI